MEESGKALWIEVQNIDHLGIVAGIVDKIGLVEEIDRKLGTHPQEWVSCGRAVKTMILNGLDFLSAPYTCSRSSSAARLRSNLSQRSQMLWVWFLCFESVHREVASECPFLAAP